MEEFSMKELGVKVGLEIHQQLATNKKLFCDCKQIESDEYDSKFQRKLRMSKGELGEFDPAAIFENTKSKTIVYYANPQSSCLVEKDEEPPHNLDNDAKKIALLIASTLKSSIFSEIYPMRKTVIDGSNPTGFQRTMLISMGGSYEVDGKKIGIQSICLEEDAAKILGDEGNVRKYGLERLGIPLVEIATEPFEVKSQEIKKIALSLGRILRSTKKVNRGLGSIRQDVNVSIRESGMVIEVKGVQQLDQLEKVVEYEAKRQHGLIKISKELQKRNWAYIEKEDKQDITDLFSDCKSKIIQNSLKKNHRMVGIRFKNMKGMFGHTPYEGIRLGKEVAELVRFFGIGGVFHSDELPNYGIEDEDVEKIKSTLSVNEKDAFLVVALPEKKLHSVVEQIILRISNIKENEMPADTRLATQSGETKFLRPRPGSARMYPETDIPPITITKKEMEKIKEQIPKSWEESISDLQKKYEINLQLAEQIFDSEYLDLFEKICEDNRNSPNYVASTLCSTITNLERGGLNRKLLDNKIILEVFELLADQKIPKESMEIIFEGIMSGKQVSDVISEATSNSLSEDRLNAILETIIDENCQIVQNQGERSIGPLMGIAMKTLRGKISGEKINKKLSEKILDRLNKN